MSFRRLPGVSVFAVGLRRASRISCPPNTDAGRDGLVAAWFGLGRPRVERRLAREFSTPTPGIVFADAVADHISWCCTRGGQGMPESIFGSATQRNVGFRSVV